MHLLSDLRKTYFCAFAVPRSH